MLAVLGGLMTHGTYAGSGDEPHYLVIAHSLAFDHDLDLANNYGAGSPLIGGGNLQPENHARIGAGGVLRPVHDVGMPLLFSPYVRTAEPLAAAAAAHIPARIARSLKLTPWIVYRNAIAAMMILLTAWLATRLQDLFSALGASSAAAFWTAALIALSPPVMIFSILFFTEMVSATLCLMLCTVVAFDDTPRRPAMWAIAGAGSGLLLLVHIRNAGMVAALVVLASVRLAGERRPRHLAAFAAGLVPMLLARGALTHHLWGTWVVTPIANAGPWMGVTAQIRIALGRLAGLLVDQEYGLLPYAPIYLLVPFGLLVLARTHRRAALAIVVVAGSYVLLLLPPATNTAGWTGGWSPAARFLMPIVPLLAIGVAAGIRAAPRAVLVPLLVLQIAVDAYAWQHPKVMWNNGTGHAAVCSRLGPTFCEWLPSFVQVQ